MWTYFGDVPEELIDGNVFGKIIVPISRLSWCFGQPLTLSGEFLKKIAQDETLGTG